MRRLLLVLAIVCALGVVAPTVGSADQGGTNRPYKATQSATITPTGGTFPGPFTAVLTGTSIATHLGKSSFLQHVSLTFPVPLVPCVTPSGPGVVNNFTGTVTLTAANGDQLFTSFSGTGCGVPSPGIGTNSGTTTFGGGTGRFVDASGSATFTSTIDQSVSPNVSETRVVGTISY
jgi:hypothetical protein